jgi:hypothetical protein
LETECGRKRRVEGEEIGICEKSPIAVEDEAIEGYRTSHLAPGTEICNLR